MDFVKKALEAAKRMHHRRLFVVSGDWKKSMKVVGQILREAMDYVGETSSTLRSSPRSPT